MNWRRAAIPMLLKLSGSEIPRCLEEIRSLASEPREVVRGRRDELLERTLSHAARHVPYYRRVLREAGVVVDGSVRLDRLAEVPLLTKDIIRTEGESLHADDGLDRGRYENTSGGSTGEPVRFVQDRRYDAWNIATKIYFNEVLGKHLGEREIKLWGSDRDILAGTIGLKDKLVNFLYNRRFFNSYRLGEAELSELVELNNRFRPRAYWSYMESALELARYVRRSGARFEPPAILVSTIGPLSEEVREEIASGLGCGVYNQYGSREVGVIAAECPRRQGLHTFPWYNHVEVVDATGRPIDSGEGEIVVTTLRNESMPLIRYKIGDVAIVSPERTCPCGRFTPMLESVMGRTLGYFRKADGSLVHSHFLVQAMFHRAWVRRFQIVQDRLDRVVVRIEREPGADAPGEALEDIRRKTRVLMGEDCEVAFEYPPHLERSASGKFLYTICQVS